MTQLILEILVYNMIHIDANVNITEQSSFYFVFVLNWLV